MSWQLSKEHQNLLRATLCRGDEADVAWRAWRADVDFEQLDVASYRLLPMLHRNLDANQVEDTLLPRLRGVYKRTWVENQMLLRTVTSVTHLLGKREISSALLGEALMVQGKFGQRMIRAINHATLSIPGSQQQLAAACLKEAGWQPRSRLRRWLRPSPAHTAVYHSPPYSIRVVWDKGEGKSADAQLQFILHDPISDRENNRLVLLADIFHLARQTSVEPYRQTEMVQTLQTIIDLPTVES